MQQKYDLCILLSGPEPQRTFFENLVLESINQIKGTILLVRGKPLDQSVLHLTDNITVFNHLNAAQLGEAVQASDIILCRSGYSTIMEMIALKKKMILVPTPQQTEQEYLAKLLEQRKLAISVKQHDFKLEKVLTAAKDFLILWSTA